VRPSFERLSAWFVVAVAGVVGAVAAVAPLLSEGLVLGGSACGGGGEEQRCTGIARRLSIVDVSPRAWWLVAAGVACVLLAVTALLLRRRQQLRVLVAAALLVLTVLAFGQTSQVDALLGPEGGGTWGRTLEEWGPFLSPSLADLRQDALRRYGGTRTEPGGPLYDREQILPTFSVREQTGWRLLHGSFLVLLFGALFGVASSITSRPGLAVTLAGTTGLVAWTAIVVRASPCEEECWDAVAMIFAVGAAALWWLAYGAVVQIGRAVRRRSDG
jgi:hypothetical protein